MKLAGSNYGAPTLPLDDVLAHCARLGFRGAELAVQPGYTTAVETLDGAARRAIAGAYRRFGLECSLVCYYGGPLSDPARGRGGEAALRAAIDLAAELAPVGPGGTPPPVTTTSGGRPPDWEALRERIAAGIGDLCHYAARRGVSLAMKAHAGNALNLPHKLIWLLEQIDSPALSFNVDMSHYEVNGLTIRQAVPALLPHASHVHVKASRGRYPDHEFMVPGEGQSDFVSLFRAVAAGGYAGYLSVEISVHVQARPQYDPLEALTRSFRALSGALDEAGVAGDAGPR